MTMITIIPDTPRVPETPLGRMRELVVAGAALVGIFIIGAGTWAAVAPLESAAIASGTVVSDSHRKTVQHLEGGIINAILVHDGDTVRAGQVLLRLDDTKARTTLGALLGQLADAKARQARLLAERDSLETIGFPADFLERANEDAPLAAAIAGQQ